MHLLQGEMAHFTHRNTNWTLVFYFSTHIGYCNKDKLAEIRALVGNTVNWPSERCFLCDIHSLKFRLKCLTNIPCYKNWNIILSCQLNSDEFHMNNWQEMPAECAQSRTIWTHEFIMYAESEHKCSLCFRMLYDCIGVHFQNRLTER